MRLSVCPVELFQPSLISAGKTRSPRGKHLKVTLVGWAPALLTNIRLAGQGLPGTNALTLSFVSDQEIFLTLTLGVGVIKLFLRHCR